MTLRLPRQEDLEEYVRIHELSWPHFGPWMPQQPPGETFGDMFTRQLDRAMKGAEDEREFRFVGFSTDGRIVGFFGLSQIYRGAFHNAYAGWSVNVEFIGHGYATEAMTTMLDFAFASPPTGIGLHRVQANIIPHNAASVRVAEKCGFRFEGIAKRYLKIAGEWQDHSMYAKLAEEHTPVFLMP
jgi:[ribosomal protein S5]-alanine N-acetyltransferase